MIGESLYNEVVAERDELRRFIAERIAGDANIKEQGRSRLGDAMNGRVAPAVGFFGLLALASMIVRAVIAGVAQ